MDFFPEERVSCFDPKWKKKWRDKRNFLVTVYCIKGHSLTWQIHVEVLIQVWKHRLAGYRTISAFFPLSPPEATHRHPPCCPDSAELQRTNLARLLLKSRIRVSLGDISRRRKLMVSACSAADLVTWSKNLFGNHKLSRMFLPGSLNEKTQQLVRNQSPHPLRGRETSGDGSSSPGKGVCVWLRRQDTRCLIDKSWVICSGTLMLLRGCYYF